MIQIFAIVLAIPLTGLLVSNINRYSKALSPDVRTLLAIAITVVVTSVPTGASVVSVLLLFMANMYYMPKNLK